MSFRFVLPLFFYLYGSARLSQFCILICNFIKIQKREASANSGGGASIKEEQGSEVVSFPYSFTLRSV